MNHGEQKTSLAEAWGAGPWRTQWPSVGVPVGPRLGALATPPTGQVLLFAGQKFPKETKPRPHALPARGPGLHRPLPGPGRISMGYREMFDTVSLANANALASEGCTEVIWEGVGTPSFSGPQEHPRQE